MCSLTISKVFIDPHDDKARGATGSGRRSHAMTFQSCRTGGPNPCESTATSTGSARPALGFATHQRLRACRTRGTPRSVNVRVDNRGLKNRAALTPPRTLPR